MQREHGMPSLVFKSVAAENIPRPSARDIARGLDRDDGRIANPEREVVSDNCFSRMITTGRYSFPRCVFQ